jgi:hypothetical protein
VTTVDTMRAWGIVNPEQVVAIAASTGLPLALACSLLDQESGGGRNVWGHDGVDTGGVYTKGAPVTREAYLAYKRLATTKVIGRQGVGPCQLTAASYQDAADARGGCWDWTANVTTGFSGLVALVNRYGLPDGVRRYNGSGPAAEVYRNKMMDRYRGWTTKLGPLPVVPPTDGDDMQPDERAALLEVRDMMRAAGIGKGRLPGRSPSTSKTSDDAFGWILSGAAFADEAADGISALRSEVAALAAKFPTLPADWPSLLAAALVVHVTTGKATP